jgi:hypothetical protein
MQRATADLVVPLIEEHASEGTRTARPSTTLDPAVVLRHPGRGPLGFDGHHPETIETAENESRLEQLRAGGKFLLDGSHRWCCPRTTWCCTRAPCWTSTPTAWRSPRQTLTLAMRNTVRTPRRHRFDVVEGSGRIYVQSMVGESGRPLSSATMTRHGSPWSAGIRMFRKRAGGPCGGRGLMLRAAIRESQWRSGMTWPVPGVERADGRAVVMGCDEPLARGGGAVQRVGADWFGANRAGRWAFRDAQVCCWWAGGLRRCHGVVTLMVLERFG